MREISVQRLSTATVYRLFFRGLMWGAIPIFSVLGVVSYFGLSTLTWNDRPLTGFTAIVGGPFIGLLFALVGTAVFGTAAAVGLWIHSKFYALKLEYDEPSDPRQQSDA